MNDSADITVDMSRWGKLFPYWGYGLSSEPNRPHLQGVTSKLILWSGGGAGSEAWQTRIAVGVPAVDCIVESLLVELISECPSEPVEVGHVKIVLLAERGELVVIGNRAKLVVEVREALWWMLGDPLVVVETEVVFALAVDDVADHDQRDLRDGALAAEGREIEIDHRADGAVALPRCQPEAATQGVRKSEFFETVSALTVALHCGVAFLVKPTDVLTQVVFGRVCAADARRARRNQPPAADGFVALEVSPRDGTITGTLAEPTDIRLFSERGRTFLGG